MNPQPERCRIVAHPGPLVNTESLSCHALHTQSRAVRRGWETSDRRGRRSREVDGPRNKRNFWRVGGVLSSVQTACRRSSRSLCYFNKILKLPTMNILRRLDREQHDIHSPKKPLFRGPSTSRSLLPQRYAICSELSIPPSFPKSSFIPRFFSSRVRLPRWWEVSRGRCGRGGGSFGMLFGFLDYSGERAGRG